MPVKIFSAALLGLEAHLVEVEVAVSYGLRSFEIVGLGDKAVEESRQRVSCAIKSTQLKSPDTQPIKLLVNLAPADLKKQGTLYDLAIALGYLLANNQIKFNPDKKIFLGELALDGKLRPVRGVISITIQAKEKGFKQIVLPKENAKEAAQVKGIEVIGVNSLREAVLYLENKLDILPEKPENYFKKDDIDEVNLDWVAGQNFAKRAIEIAAAGGHNLLMQGPPGTGKTLLAKSIISILPPLSFDESLEVTKIYSIAGLLPFEAPIIKKRPFRAPHHTCSEASLIGGGNPPQIGEITLAHRGVLFLDEFPEFHRDLLESLRQPLEDGKVNISRKNFKITLPSAFTLVCATNPCPCGYYNDPQRECTCSPSQIAKYRRKLSGPLVDRIDLFINVPRVEFDKLTDSKISQETEKVKKNVEKARAVQFQRLKNDKILLNSQMQVPQVEQYCQINYNSKLILKNYVNSGRLSPRGFHKVLKVARTISDLEEKPEILPEHIAEALMFRQELV